MDMGVIVGNASQSLERACLAPPHAHAGAGNVRHRWTTVMAHEPMQAWR